MTAPQSEAKATLRMRHCFNCGTELGLFVGRDYDRRDTCGAPECDQVLRDLVREERDDAHRRLDEDMGW
jgi:hypothetical protein